MTTVPTSLDETTAQANTTSPAVLYVTPEENVVSQILLFFMLAIGAVVLANIITALVRKCLERAQHQEKENKGELAKDEEQAQDSPNLHPPTGYDVQVGMFAVMNAATSIALTPERERKSIPEDNELLIHEAASNAELNDVPCSSSQTEQFRSTSLPGITYVQQANPRTSLPIVTNYHTQSHTS